MATAGSEANTETDLVEKTTQWKSNRVAPDGEGVRLSELSGKQRAESVLQRTPRKSSSNARSDDSRILDFGQRAIIGESFSSKMLRSLMSPFQRRSSASAYKAEKQLDLSADDILNAHIDNHKSVLDLVDTTGDVDRISSLQDITRAKDIELPHHALEKRIEELRRMWASRYDGKEELQNDLVSLIDPIEIRQALMTLSVKQVVSELVEDISPKVAETPAETTLPLDPHKEPPAPEEDNKLSLSNVHSFRSKLHKMQSEAARPGFKENAVAAAALLAIFLTLGEPAGNVKQKVSWALKPLADFLQSICMDGAGPLIESFGLQTINSRRLLSTLLPEPVLGRIAESAPHACDDGIPERTEPQEALERPKLTRLGSGRHGIVYCDESTAEKSVSFDSEFTSVASRVERFYAEASVLEILTRAQQASGELHVIPFVSAFARYQPCPSRETGLVLQMACAKSDLPRYRDGVHFGMKPPFEKTVAITLCKVASKVAASLHFCASHGVAHFDVRCDNILVYDDIPVLADFGESQVFASDKKPEVYCSRGTECIKAPEMLKVNAAGTVNDSFSEAARTRSTFTGAGPKSDVWSLGCLIFELFTGEYLYDESTAAWAQFFARVTRDGSANLPLIPQEKLGRLGELYGEELAKFICDELLSKILVSDHRYRPEARQAQYLIDSFICSLEGQGDSQSKVN